MADKSPHEVTQLLVDWSGGDQSALNKLLPLVDAELHRLAHHYMSRERVGHTLQTTALVNEAYLRLVGQDISWQSRAHFFGIAAKLMRQILVDYARKRRYLKRGGNAQQVSLDEAAIVVEKRANEIIALDEALQDLSAIAPDEETKLDHTLRSIREALGEAASGAAWTEGREMTTETAIQYALASDTA